MRLRSIAAITSTAIAFLLLVVGITRAQDEETRKHLLHELGGPFFVSRDKVQEELKLSDEQKQKLRDKLTADLQEGGKLVERLKGVKGGAREEAMRPSYERLEAFLQENLKADQLKRFQQLKLQYDTPAIMVRPEIVKELKITDEQRKQFMDSIQEMQKEIGPLTQMAHSGGNPQEILQKVTKLRQDCQGKIEALLSDAQKQQWVGMIGQPFVIW
jgi:uncharacterized protein YoxC